VSVSGHNNLDTIECGGAQLTSSIRFSLRRRICACVRSSEEADTVFPVKEMSPTNATDKTLELLLESIASPYPYEEKTHLICAYNHALPGPPSPTRRRGVPVYLYSLWGESAIFAI
jgi:hypothetical protein